MLERRQQGEDLHVHHPGRRVGHCQRTVAGARETGAARRRRRPSRSPCPADEELVSIPRHGPLPKREPDLCAAIPDSAPCRRVTTCGASAPACDGECPAGTVCTHAPGGWLVGPTSAGARKLRTRPHGRSRRTACWPHATQDSGRRIAVFTRRAVGCAIDPAAPITRAACAAHGAGSGREAPPRAAPSWRSRASPARSVAARLARTGG